MACKDCIHFEVCDRTDMKGCPHFKDRSEFAEVVRCGNCKHFYKVDSTSNKGCAWGNCRNRGNSTTYANEFCSRGEVTDND